MGFSKNIHHKSKGGYALKNDTVFDLHAPEEPVEDILTETLRQGSRKLLAQAVEAEVAEFLASHDRLVDDEGRRLIVRNGHLPERAIQTGIGAVPVKVPRIRDRRDVATDEKIHFTSNMLPPYLRRSASMEELLPCLYLKGISTGQFGDALKALLGSSAPGLSAATITRLKGVWRADYLTWQKRSLERKRYVYFWADGIYLNARLGDRQCLLVIIGGTAGGKKEVVAIESGFRENEISWKDLLLDLKRRGLEIDPKLAVGDGALGFWKALGKVYPATSRQRCWVHKTANVLNKLPKSMQGKAKERLHQIWMAPTKEEAEKAFSAFVESYESKYPKASECLAKDKSALLAFYDFPAEHWKHIRTTNPIESTFSTVRHRTVKTRGCLSRESGLSMVFQLCLAAEKKWQKLNAPKRLAEVIEGVKFINGERKLKHAA
jgi:transposase-like protein